MVSIPYMFKPRDYQMDFWRYMDDGGDTKGKRAILVWHRRTGKDKSCWNFVIREAFRVVGNYFYAFPSYAQGKKALWDNIDNDGFKTIYHIPKQIVEGSNNQEMIVKLNNGSTIQVVGTDGRNIDRLVGTNPRGVVFSEWALQSDGVWDLLRPILAVNKGRAVFNSTPRGKNHLYSMYEMYKDNPNWFVQKLSVDDTGIIDKETLREEELSMDRDLYLQEYYCSFEGAVSGSYYGRQFEIIEEEKRITTVPYEEGIDVHVVWDLGMSDSTALWFVQFYGREIRLLEYYENSGEGLSHYVEYVKSKEYQYGTFYLPHDIEVRELSTGISRRQFLINSGITNMYVLKAKQVQEGIESVRRILKLCWFDKEKCKQGIRCLKEYKKAYDEKNKRWKNRPLHDWASHGADAFRYLAMAYEEKQLFFGRSNLSVVKQDYFGPMNG